MWSVIHTRRTGRVHMIFITVDKHIKYNPREGHVFSKSLANHFRNLSKYNKYNIQNIINYIIETTCYTDRVHFADFISHLVNTSQFDKSLSGLIEQLAEFTRQFLQLGPLHGCLQRSLVSSRNPVSQVCNQRQRTYSAAAK